MLTEVGNDSDEAMQLDNVLLHLYIIQPIVYVSRITK